MSFKNMANSSINESPVGSRGRTTFTDADKYIDENPDVIEQFKTIVKKMGGKAVARRILDRMNNQVMTVTKIVEATQTVEDYLRDVGFKVKKVTPLADGSKEIELYKYTDIELAIEDLKDAGFGKEYDLSTDGYKNIITKEI